MKESDYKKKLKEEELKAYQKCVDLLEKGSRKKAAEKLDRFLDENPHFIPALNKKAVIHIYEKKYNKAQSILNQIVKKDPDFAPAVTNLGSIAKEMGNSARAKELYKKALDIDEEYGPAYNNLGVIYREEGDYAQSVKYLKKARKMGSISFQLNKDQPFYKDPGCLFVIFLALAVIFILFLIST